MLQEPTSYCCEFTRAGPEKKEALDASKSVRPYACCRVRPRAVVGSRREEERPGHKGCRNIAFVGLLQESKSNNGIWDRTRQAVVATCQEGRRMLLLLVPVVLPNPIRIRQPPIGLYISGTTDTDEFVLIWTATRTK